VTDQAPKPVRGLGDAQVGMWLCGLVAFASFCFLGFETIRCIYEWAKYGDAEFLRLVQFGAGPEVKWVGIQSVISFLWNAPMFYEAIAVLIGSTWLWGIYSEEVDSLKRQLPTSNGASGKSI
jgi:hypothetical protein